MSNAEAQTALTCQMKELQHVVSDLNLELRNINDEKMGPALGKLLEIAGAIVSLHGQLPGRSLANDLSNLLSAARMLDIPFEDDQLGRTMQIRLARNIRAVLISNVEDVLTKASEVGLFPRQALQPIEVAELRKGDNAALIFGLVRRLVAVEESLETLARENKVTGATAQQKGLVNIYVNEVRPEISLAKFHLEANAEVIDVNGFVKAIESITDLTKKFTEAIDQIRTQISQVLLHAADLVRRQVKRVATGAKYFIKHLERTSKHLAPNADSGDVSEAQAPRYAEFTKQVADLGQMLRGRREEIGMSIEDVRSITRIRPSMLEAIELGQLWHLPKGYEIGFVKAYANAVSLNGERVAADLKAIVRESDQPL